MRERHAVFTEATDAGFIGASVVAIWFLVRDLLAGHPLRTPSVLGQLFLLGDPHPDTQALVFGAIVLYTGVHFILFVLFAFLVALMVRRSVDQPAIRFALLVLFVAFEFCFYVIVNAVSEEVGSLFPLWTVVTANLLATAAMAAYFWRRYPELGDILRKEPLGA
jgi:hypothetical protein